MSDFILDMTITDCNLLDWWRRMRWGCVVFLLRLPKILLLMISVSVFGGGMQIFIFRFENSQFRIRMFAYIYSHSQWNVICTYGVQILNISYVRSNRYPLHENKFHKKKSARHKNWKSAQAAVSGWVEAVQQEKSKQSIQSNQQQCLTASAFLIWNRRILLQTYSSLSITQE